MGVVMLVANSREWLPESLGDVLRWYISMTIAWSWFNKEKAMDPTTRFAGLTSPWVLFVVLLGGLTSPIAADPGLTTRVSVNSTGTQANGDSFLGAMSDTGRFVAFASGATNLVADDTNGVPDIFVHEREDNRRVWRKSYR
jgi:hypothetical protein